jgi:5-methylcytosine-specific restriction endonuclease McrA
MTIYTNCKVCGVGFAYDKPEGERGRTRKYCSTECKGRRYAPGTRPGLKGRGCKDGAEQACVVCESRYIPTTWQQRTCSQKCSRKLNSSHRNKPRGTSNCKRCGEEFATTVNKATFCSKRCSNTWSYENSDRFGKGEATREAKRQAKREAIAALPACTSCGKKIRFGRTKAVCSTCVGYVSDRRARGDGGYVYGCSDCGRMVVRSQRNGNPVCRLCTELKDKAANKEAKRRRRHVVRDRSGQRAERFTSTQLFDRDSWRCQLCGVKVRTYTKKRNADDEATIDHIVPLSRGGQHDMANCQCACRRCNTAKGAKMGGQMRIC